MKEERGRWQAQVEGMLGLRSMRATVLGSGRHLVGAQGEGRAGGWACLVEDAYEEAPDLQLTFVVAVNEGWGRLRAV